MRVRIALTLKEIPYESVGIDLADGEHLRERYRVVNPTAQVPCLEIDGLHLIQSMAIIEYLNETRPAPPFLPDSTDARAQARMLAEVVNSSIQPLHNLAVRQRLAEQFSAAPEALNEWCRYWIERRFAGLETLLAGYAGGFCFGDAPSLPDIFLFPQVHKAQAFGIDTRIFPTVTRVMKNLAEIPAFARSVS
jgi:maleylacetoacetate isomerase